MTRETPPREPGEGGSTRRIVVAGMSTVTVLVLLFGYHTSTEGASSTSTAVVSPAIAGTTGSSVTGSSGTATSGGTSTTASATFTGSAADTRWGPVQVEITVASGEITAVDVVEHPSGNGRDQEINARALPTLVQETLSAQNASIDMVSGATVTSTGYLTSLQSALDQAGL
ncbi:FMN-binding protein [Kineococcus sp. NBC_00420]